MRNSFWEGKLVVEGIPDFNDVNNALDFLQGHAAIWMKPDGFDEKSGLVSFSILTDMDCFRSGRPSRVNVEQGGEADRVKELASCIEDLFNGIVELQKTQITIGSPWLPQISGHKRNKFKISTETPEEYEAAFRVTNSKTEGSLESALDELDHLIGLENVKSRIREIVSLIQRRGADAMPCLHMAFIGNPGTGKTAVARIFGKILRSLGILDVGHFVETDRSGLVGRYVGETAQKTMAMIDKAMGGVLFIDEAYSLGAYCSDLEMGPDGGAGRRDFGPEAIDVLVKQMEDHRKDFVCIMAGYPNEMDMMIEVNPGLRDRISMTLEFPDYRNEELASIFEMIVNEMGFHLTSAGFNAALQAIVRLPGSDARTFGNARFMRKLAERAVMKQNLRTTDYLLEEVDILAALNDEDIQRRISPETRIPIGFAVA